METQYMSTTKINWLMLFTEIITTYSKNHTKFMNTLCGQDAELLNVKTGGTYWHSSCCFKGLSGASVTPSFDISMAVMLQLKMEGN
jgi:hypothetical protein